MTIIDSSVWIDYIADRSTRQTHWISMHLDTERIGLTDLILYEVLQGAKSDAAFLKMREELQQFVVWSTMSFGMEVQAATNHRELRRRGITVRKTVDCLIATFCIEGGHDLLHNDRDFDGFEQHLGLKVIHP